MNNVISLLSNGISEYKIVDYTYYLRSAYIHRSVDIRYLDEDIVSSLGLLNSEYTLFVHDEDLIIEDRILIAIDPQEIATDKLISYKSKFEYDPLVINSILKSVGNLFSIIEFHTDNIKFMDIPLNKYIVKFTGNKFRGRGIASFQVPVHKLCSDKSIDLDRKIYEVSDGRCRSLLVFSVNRDLHGDIRGVVLLNDHCILNRLYYSYNSTDETEYVNIELANYNLGNDLTPLCGIRSNHVHKYIIDNKVMITKNILKFLGIL